MEEVDALLVLLHLRTREEKSRVPPTPAKISRSKNGSLIKPGKALKVVNMHSAIGKACYESASLLLISDLKEMLKRAKAFSSPAVSPLWQALHCATLASSPVTLPTRLTLSLSTPRFYLRRHQYIPSQCNGWSRRAYLEQAVHSTPSPPPSDLVLLPLISP